MAVTTAESVAGLRPSQRQAGIVQGLILSLVTFLPIMATLSVAPAIPRLIAQFEDVPNVTVLIPMLMTIPAICIAVTSPFVGVLTDRLGRRRVLIAAIIIYGVFGMAPFFLDDLYVILATRVGVGVSEAMLFTVGKTLIGDYFTGERRQRWVGYQNAIDAALGTTTWLLGGLLASLGWRAPFLLYTLAVPLLIAVYFLIWEPSPRDDAEGGAAVDPSFSAFPWRRMSVVFAVTLFAGAMYFSYPTNIARALSELGVAEASRIGILTAIASIGTPIGALIYARATFVPTHAMVGVGLGFIGVSFVAIGLSGNYYNATGFGFLEQIGNGLLGAVLTMWCLTSLPFEHRGRGMGIWGTFMVSGIFLSPLIFAFIERLTGTVTSGFVIMGTICAASALIIPFIIRATTPKAILSAPVSVDHAEPR